MHAQEAQQLLDEFRSNRVAQTRLGIALDDLAKLCAAGALLRGFHDDEQFLRSAAERGLFEYASAFMDHGDTARPPMGSDKHLEWFDNQILQAELARQASEIGEAVEAVRKPGPDPHCPKFSNFLIEEADCVIRIGDTCGKRGLSLGAAVVAKLLYNMDRPWKHGKNS